MNVLLIGPPGSGKGTQGERLAARLGLEHLAAGDLLRDEVRNETPLGRRVSDLMTRGELVPDAVILGLLMPRVLAAAEADGYLLDGFPRSVEQAVEARKLAEQLAAGPTRAFGAAKRLLYEGANSTLETAMERESGAIAAAAGTKDALEGIAAFLGKRAPAFEGR